MQNMKLLKNWSINYLINTCVITDYIILCYSYYLILQEVPDPQIHSNTQAEI